VGESRKKDETGGRGFYYLHEGASKESSPTTGRGSLGEEEGISVFSNSGEKK